MFRYCSIEVLFGFFFQTQLKARSRRLKSLDTFRGYVMIQHRLMSILVVEQFRIERFLISVSRNTMNHFLDPSDENLYPFNDWLLLCLHAWLKFTFLMGSAHKLLTRFDFFLKSLLYLLWVSFYDNWWKCVLKC